MYYNPDTAGPPADDQAAIAEEMLEAQRMYQDYLCEQEHVQAPASVPTAANDYLRERTQGITPADVARLRTHYGATGRVGLYMKDGSAAMYPIKVGQQGARVLRRFGRGGRGVMCELVAIVNLDTGTVEPAGAAEVQAA